jgi:hypothetical protein
MANPLIVYLNGMGDVALLESAGGSVIEDQGRLSLQGDFRLLVSGEASNPVSFGAQGRTAIVAAEGQFFRLVESSLIWFQWAIPVRLQGLTSPQSPWLEFSLVWFLQRAGSTTLVSLDDAAISLVSDAPNPGAHFLGYPTKTGLQKEKLARPEHPQDPNRVGFFILPLDDGYGVKLGSVANRFNLDHAVALEVGFQPWACEFWFRLSRGASKNLAFLARSITTDGIFAVSGIQTTGGLAMAANPGEKAWDEINLNIAELISDGAFLKVPQKAFVPTETWLARADLGSSVYNATGMLTHSSRLELELELPLSVDLQARLPDLRIAYRDSSIGVGTPVPARDRHYGVRIAGLGSRTGGLASLDADVAVFQLTGSLGDPQFHLKAGGTVADGSGVLVPKMDSGTGRGTRRLEIPIGDLALEVMAPAIPTASAMSLDTEAGKLTFIEPQIVAAPIGITSKSNRTSFAKQESFKRWTLCLADNDPKLVLKLASEGLQAPETWVSRFVTADPQSNYAMIDHPGASLIIDPPPSPALLAINPSFKKTQFTVKKVGGKELVIYSAVVAALSYAGARRMSEGNWDFLDPSNFHVELSELDKDDLNKFVKEATVKGLQVVYFGGVEGSEAGLRKFIDDNRIRSKNPKAEKFFLPFSMGMSVLLFDSSEGQPKYADEISVTRAQKTGRTVHPSIAFDMSAHASLDPTWLGWSKWEDIATHPLLWPKFWPKAHHQTPGPRLDPSEQLWRGIFLRDLPLVFPVSDKVLEKLPWAKCIVEAINDRLMLDYAYMDEKGVTWSGGVSGLGADGLEIPFASWKGVFEVYLLGVLVLGAAGSLVTAEASVRFLLPRLRDKNKKAMEIKGIFGLDLDGPNPLGRVDIQQDDGPIDTDDIPGFRSVALKRMSTDFKTAQIEVSLVATSELAHALPFLSENPQAAFLVFNLQATPSLAFELSIPAEAQTNLFGRWPFIAQSMRLEWSDGGDIVFRISGRLNLGVGGFGSIGADILVRKSSQGLYFDLQIRQLDISISFGDAKVTGKLSWGKPKNDTSAPLKDVNKERGRDLWGALTVEDSGFLGKNQMAFRAGNKGGISYWVASLETNPQKPVNLGIGKLENPGLLFAHNADLNGKLRSLALSPEGSIFARLRPEDDVDIWLEAWEPSTSIGTTLAASGYFKIDDTVVKSPVDDPDEKDPKKNEKLLSGVMYIDTGVLRVDGVARLFTEKPAYFGMAVDFKEGKFLASFQTDPIAFGKYTFQPGRLAIGFGFGGTDYLDIRLGWPERVPGTEYERDWDQALSFHADDLPLPVNTGWGGLKVSLEPPKLTIGVAFRCGWTKQVGDVSGGSGGGFDVGYAIGGIVQFQYDSDALLYETKPRTQLSKDVLSLSTEQENIAALVYIQSAYLALETLASSGDLYLRGDLYLKGELFGDVWGSAWIKFMGVTLAAIELKAFARYRICGSLDYGITDARATCGFKVSVTILCVEYKTEARYDLVLINGTCPIRTLFTNEQLLQLTNMREARFPVKHSVIEGVV